MVNLWTTHIRFLLLHLVHQFIAGIIVGWSWRCLVSRWIKSWSLLIVLLALTSPITPAGTIAAPYCHCSTRSPLSPPHPPTSLPRPPLHNLHKLTPTASVKSSSSKVNLKTQHLNGQVVSANPNKIRTLLCNWYLMCRSTYLAFNSAPFYDFFFLRVWACTERFFHRPQWPECLVLLSLVVRQRYVHVLLCLHVHIGMKYKPVFCV